MATVNYYYRTNNSASTLPYGAVTADGAPDGSADHPWASFTAVGAGSVENYVEDVATDHSGDDLVLHFHPACRFQGTSSPFDQWTSIGKNANSWRSITLKRWEQVVTDQPLYDTEGWKPTLDPNQEHTTWTQGSISAGVWSAGTGDVYRGTIANITGNTANTLRWMGGYELGDNPGTTATIYGTWCNSLTLVTEEGDYALDSVNNYIYVKTGVVGENPTQRWGSFYYSFSGALSLEIRTCERLTFENFQWNGTMYVYSLADGDTLNDVRLINCSGRNVGSCFGWLRVATDGDPNSSAYNWTIYNPDATAMEPARMDKVTSGSIERGAENGINFDCSRTYAIRIKNPRFVGFGHAGIQIFPNQASTVDDDYPDDVKIWVDDTTNGLGTITGGPNYQRGLNFRLSKNSYVRGIRIAKQTVISQFGGDWLAQSLFFDSTCTAFSDPGGSSAYNLGSNISSFNTQYSHSYSGTTVKLRGTKHDLSGGSMFALYWGSSITAGLIDVRGMVVKDVGSDRYWPGADGTEYTYTRRKAPILAQTQAYLTSSTKQSIKDSFFILDASCVGIATWHPSGGNSDDVTTDIREATWPAVAYNDTVQWGSTYISGNQQVIGTSGLEFDSSLNYTGTLKTPPQRGTKMCNYRK